MEYKQSQAVAELDGAGAAEVDGAGAAEAVALPLVDHKDDGDVERRGSAQQPDEPYDPHQYRDVPNATNNVETLVHLLKCSLGTGILAMPQAFAHAGLVPGVLGTLLIGALVTYCLALLVRAQYTLCARLRVPLLSYPAAMRAALERGPALLRPLAAASAPLVDVFLVVYQLGICCVYIVFIATNLKRLVDPVYEMSVEAWMAVALGPLLLFNLIRDLKRLAPWSTAANAATLAGLAVIIYYLSRGERAPNLQLWGEPAAFPLFFGTTLFALTAVGVVIALENNMKTPASFVGACGVLNVGMSVIVALYVLTGALGYSACGARCSDSITLDLPQHEALSRTVLALLVAAIFVSYGLQCYVPVEVLWRGYLRPRLLARAPPCAPGGLLRAEYALRLALCLLTFVVAVLVPRLGLFISLFGALCLSALGVCFPAALDALAHWPPPAARAARDAAIFVVGLLGLVIGTYTALLAIVRSF